MYNSMHEADIQKFVDVIDDIFDNCYQPTHLQQIRNEQGLSQSQRIIIITTCFEIRSVFKSYSGI